MNYRLFNTFASFSNIPGIRHNVTEDYVAFLLHTK